MSRPTPSLLVLLPLLFAAVFAIWWLPNRPQAGNVAMVESRFNSVSFAPFRRGQSPLTDRFPSAAQAEADVALVAGRVRAIRSYAAIEGDYDVAGMAQRHGLKLWLGIWLGGDRASNEREIAKGIAVARAYPDTVDRVVVGNEVLLRRDLPVGELIAAIDRVRAAVRQPVTYADVWEFWTQFPEVAPHVDIVTIHLLPYWEDVPTGIGRAVEHVGAVYDRMAALFPAKRVAIGETGWPSRGRWRDDAAPSVVNQALFLRRFIALAHAKGFEYNLIEAFDQEWKYKNEGVVGANWGLWTSDRAAKFPLDGPVVETRAWAIGALGSCVAACLLLLVGLAAAPPLLPWQQHRMAVLATALGAALGYAAADTAPDLYDVYQRLAAVANLGGQAALALLLMPRAALLLRGDALPPARSGADATQRVGALLRLRVSALAGWRDWGLDELGFVFLWAATVLQALLLFDSRYRDFPFPTFAVPLVCVAARAMLGDRPPRGCRETLAAGGALAVAAIASALAEGPLNAQALGWSVCALVLAAWWLWGFWTGRAGAVRTM